uniref:Uncharacterized protein n=1 Tax=Cyprinodon variegatus TaxID=28743 RepID=A0A3Q2DZQ2_CYPVA
INIQTFDPTSRLFAPLSSASSNSCWSLRNLVRLLLAYVSSSAHPGLQLLNLLLASLHGDLLRLIQTVLQIFDGLLHVLLHTLQVSAGVSLHFLLQSKRFIPAAGFRLKGALKSIHHSLLVSLYLFHLFIFFSQLTFKISFDLVQFELDSQNLPFLMLKRGL